MKKKRNEMPIWESDEDVLMPASWPVDYGV